MKESFRVRRSLLVQSIVCTLFFLALAVACVSVALVDEPEQYGFKGEHAVIFCVLLGIVFWGGWTLLGIYTVLAYRLQGVNVVGTSILVKSVFGDHQFDISDVRGLVWNSRTRGGRLEFHALDRRPQLDLYAYAPAERLRMIRVFQGLVPADRQDGWPMFCQQVALPLRDECQAPAVGDPPPVAGADEVLVTRWRYDRLAIVLLPVALVVAPLVWAVTSSPSSLALPALLRPPGCFCASPCRAKGKYKSDYYPFPAAARYYSVSV